MSMASITLFCKSSKLFQNMFNILYFFETNSFIASPPPPSSPYPLKRNTSQTATRTISHHFWKPFICYFCSSELQSEGI